MPLRLHGAGTKAFYGECTAGEPLDVSAHRGIIAYEPSELMLRARCGTRLSELEASKVNSSPSNRPVLEVILLLEE
jgi:glycolate oxidase FAD binding subunit